jgi:DNA-binding NarL/FixJ family response regulator
MNKNRIDVALADDHALMRDGLKTIIASMKEFNMMMDAANGKELLDKLKKHPSLPSVLMLDINMPVMNGYETMKIIRERYPGIKVLTVSMYESEFSIIQMFRLGAKGYLEKSCDTKQLRLALLAVAKGEFYHSEEISNTMMSRMQKGSLPHGLTPRELEFLTYCCSELAYKEIADRMQISERTVHGYRDTLFEKLEVKSRTGLAIYAINAGLVASGNTP